MDSYTEIKLKSDAEMRLNSLLNAVYSKFHKALFDLKANNIGVSFPNYKYRLGDTLRIHSSESRLLELQQINWLGGMSGYCKVETIQAVPQHTQYRVISRIQPKMTEAKLRRLIKRGSISDDEAKAYKQKMFSQSLDAPYVTLESNSNRHKHRRYIHFGDLVDKRIEGVFDTFGLSKTATIPWF